MFNLGMGEITVILLLALIFLGPSKLPDLAAGLGKLIKEVRKATSDVKNEIALDDSFRKPFEELRDAVTLHPDELKRRDEWKKQQEEMAKRAEEAAKAEAEAQKQGETTPPPPDGLASPVTTMGVSHPKLEEPVAPPPAAPPVAAPEMRSGPNDTVIQAVPHGATLADIPTPPPEPIAKQPSRPVRVPPPEDIPTPPPQPVAKQPSGPVKVPPAGAVARRPTPPPMPTLNAAPPAAPATANGESGGANITQILKEEDLIPSTSGGKPPPPPHLPGLRPAGAPRPPRVTPSIPPNPLDKKNKP